MSSGIIDLIKSGEIDPYQVLGFEPGCNNSNTDLADVKRQYKKRAKDIHPDKQIGGSDVEFKILNACYLYIKHQGADDALFNRFYASMASDGHSDSYDQVGPRLTDDEFKGYLDPEINMGTDRKKLFVDDTIMSESDYLEQESKKKKSTSYTTDDPELSVKKFFTGKRFNLDKFNAVFDKMKQEYEATNERTLVRRDPNGGLLGLDSGDILVKARMSTEAGIVIYDQNHAKTAAISRSGGLSSYNPTGGMSLTSKIFKSVKKTDVEERKKQFIKPSAGELKKKMMQSQAEYSESMRGAKLETRKELDTRKAKNLVYQHTENQKFLLKNMHIFPKAIQEEIKLKIAYEQQQFLKE